MLFLVQNNQRSLYALNVFKDFQDLTLKVLKKIKALKLTEMYTLYLNSNTFLEVIVSCFQLVQYCPLGRGSYSTENATSAEQREEIEHNCGLLNIVIKNFKTLFFSIKIIPEFHKLPPAILLQSLTLVTD